MARTRIFISYRRNNEGGHFSLALKNRLEKDGYDCFRDQEGLHQGAWKNQLFTEIDRRDYFILLLTEGAFDGRGSGDTYVEEINRALKSGKKIIPFMLGKFETSSIPEELSAISNFEHIRLSGTSEDEFEAAMARLEHRFAKRSLVDYMHSAKGRASGIVALLIVVLLVASKGFGVLATQPLSSDTEVGYFEDEVVVREYVNESSIKVIGSGPWVEALNEKISDSFDTDGEFEMELLTRRAGSHEWAKTINASINDEIEFLIYYRNTSDSLAENVMVRDVLPDSVTYIDGSTVLYNSNYQSGVHLKDNTVITSGINIGGYNPGGNAYVVFRVRVMDNGLTEKKYINNARVDADNTGLTDSATLCIFRESLNVNVRVRQNQTDEWSQYLDVSANDEVEFIVYVENAAEETANDVHISLALSKGLEYVNGSAVLHNGSVDVMPLSAFDMDSVNIGSYAPGQSAYVVFKARVKPDILEDGRNKLGMSVLVSCGHFSGSWSCAVYAEG